MTLTQTSPTSANGRKGTLTRQYPRGILRNTTQTCSSGSSATTTTTNTATNTTATTTNPTTCANTTTTTAATVVHTTGPCKPSRVPTIGRGDMPRQRPLVVKRYVSEDHDYGDITAWPALDSVVDVG